DLLRALEAEDVPCARIQSVREAVADPQVAANGAVVESEHPRAGRIREPAPAARFERTPARAGGPAPGLGEHTDEILSDLGLDAAEIAALRDAGVLA
ncbi:MAG TPA: CoA transferase, partial [Myxococcota bacterium]|nr:CoA transferase [Myxococcota bacterium]